MARVFVSYASQDQAQAMEICRWLEEGGHEVFLDHHPQHGIAPGAEWDGSLHERLRWADAVVCVLTSDYLASVWCTAEVAIARSRGGRILPVRADRNISHPLLPTIQYIELTAARDALEEALRRIDVTGGMGWPDDRSPFPGLRPFDVEMRRAFFGRTQEIDDLAALVRSPAEQADPAVLLVVGPSGCGKSSLVRAGLVPVVADEPSWLVLHPFLPGHHPMAALARELAAAAATVGLDWTADAVRVRLVSEGLPVLVSELLAADPDHRRTRLLVIVDQLEELVTQTPPAHRAEFAEVLRATLTGPVQVVATIRPEFLKQLMLAPDLDALATRVYTMRPLRRDALRTVIESPAALAGIQIAEPLVSRLVADTDTGEALPLLAFTLAELARDAERGDELTVVAYERLGGVQGALVRQADAALDSMVAAGHTRDEVIAALLRLVSVNEDGHPTRYRVPSESLPLPFKPFLARHLLTTDNENGTAVIRVAHDAFLTAWPPLTDAIDASASALRARHHVERAAGEWSGNDRPVQRLWVGGQLAAAIEDTGVRIRSRALATPLVDLDQTAKEFLYLSHRRERIRRIRTVLAIAVATTMVVALIFTIQQHANEAQLRLALARQLQAQVDAARDVDPRTALALGVAAYHLQPDGDTKAGLVETLMTTRYRGDLAGDTRVTSTTFSPDGRVLAVGTTASSQSPYHFGAIELWDFADPDRPHRLGSATNDHTNDVGMVAFTPDGRTLLSAHRRKVLLWDVSDPERPRQVGVLPAIAASQALFSPDSRTVTLTDFDDNVIRWDIADPARPHQLETLMKLTDFVPSTDDVAVGVSDLAVSPDGRHAVHSSLDGSVTLWDAMNPTHSTQLVAPSDALIGGLAFSPDGRTVVINRDTGPFLWDLTDPARPQPLGEAPTPVGGGVMAFSSDGDMLAASLNDNSVALWDITDRAHPRMIGEPLAGHSTRPRALAFSPDGSTLISGSESGTMMWRTSGPIRPDPVGPPLVTDPADDGTQAGVEPSFAPDGRTLVTGDNTASQIWDITNPVNPRRIGPPLSGHETQVLMTAYTMDGHTLLTASQDRVIVWDVSDRTRPVRTGQYIARDQSMGAFVATNDQLVSSAAANQVLAWDLTGHVDPRPTIGFRQTAGSMADFGWSSPDGRTLAAMANRVELWDASDLRNVRLMPTPALAGPDILSPVAFAPNGDTLATSSADNQLNLWNISTPTEPTHLSTSIVHNPSQFIAMTFSHDGELLATNSADGTFTLWDVSNPTEPRRVSEPSHSEHVSSPWTVRFSPDDHLLLLGGWNTHATGLAITLWDLTGVTDVRHHPVAHACAITHRGLNQQEWNRYLPGVPFEETCLP